MTNYAERLKNLDDKKLMDVVKNYRQYGYDESIRATAISILETRGITQQELEITGNFSNKTYDHATKLYYSFSKNSKIAFILFVIILLTNVLIPIVVSLEFPENLIIVSNWILIIAYFIFLIKSFLNQYHCYKIIKQDYGGEGILMYFFLGMPFYIFMYFYFRKQMKERINEIK